MLADFAHPVECAADVIRLVSPQSSAPVQGVLPFAQGGAEACLPAFAPAPEELGIEGRAVVEALGDEALHIDQVCETTGLPCRVVAEVLLTLTLQAVVVEGPAGFFRRARR